VDAEQSRYQIRFDWGITGATAVGADADVVVWADALANPGSTVDVGSLPTGAAVIAADLRTARAAAAWAAARQRQLGRRTMIAVVAAGELRADGTLRYAVEDHLVAGAVIAFLGSFGIDATSPEAAVADAAYRGLDRAVGHLVTASVGGRGASLVPGMFRVDPDLDAGAVTVLRAPR
jgi:2-phosphosulfolactate phosphatase